MKHVNDHIRKFGYSRRGSSEENKMDHKNFKALYKATNLDHDAVDPELLTSFLYRKDQLNHTVNTDSYSDTSVKVQDNITKRHSD